MKVFLQVQFFAGTQISEFNSLKTLKFVPANNSVPKVADLPKYAVHGRGTTKPPAPESLRTTSSLDSQAVYFLSCIFFFSVGK